MKQRCNNPNEPTYPEYGGRGITICQRWIESFEAFLADIGPIPPGMSIDRIDVNGNYEPGNCRFATATTQARNKRNNVVLTHDGVTCTLAEWAERLGMSYSRLRSRHQRGYSPADILSDRHLRRGRSQPAAWHPRGARNPSAKLTPADTQEIRARYAAGGITQVQLATEYGVIQATISKVLRGATWKDDH